MARPQLARRRVRRARESTAWEQDPRGSVAERRNALTARLDGAAAVAFDLARMRITTAWAIEVKLESDGPLALTLIGRWRRKPSVSINGRPLAASLEAHRLTFTLPDGTSSLTIAPRTSR